MKIFIAGGSGTLGVPLVRELVRRGHEVTALTRTPGKAPQLGELGATPAVADVFDAAALTRLVSQSAPTHVVNLLTALPKAGVTKASDLQATNRIRVEGTRNLIEAAARAGARRIVAESFLGVYGLGDHGPAPKAEDAPFLPAHRSRAIQESVDAMRSLERQTLDASTRGLEPVVLRYGAFYGAGNESTRIRFEQVRRRRSPVVRHDRGCLPFLHEDDAVSATIAALERGAPGGIYNVADDQAVSASEFTRWMADAIGAPAPFAVPLWVLKLAMPYLAEVVSTRLVLSTLRAKRELGWEPRFGTARQGLADVAARLDLDHVRAGRQPAQASEAR